MRPIKEFTQLCLNRKLTLQSVDSNNSLKLWTDRDYPLGKRPDDSWRHEFKGEITLATGENNASLVSMYFVIKNNKFGQPGVLHVYGLGQDANNFPDNFIYASLDLTFVDSDEKAKFNRDIYINLEATSECSSLSELQGRVCWSESFIDFEDIESVISVSPEGGVLDLSTGFWVDAYKAELFMVVTVCLSSRTTHDFLAEPSALPKMSSPAILSKLLKRILELQINCDVVIRVEALEIPAHMAILSANSPVFSAMFQTDMKEKNSGIVNIGDMSAQAVEAMLHYLYYRDTDKMETNVDIALEILRAADKYDIPEMKFTITSFLCEESPNQFPMMTILDMYSYGHELELEEIKSKAIEVLREKVRADPSDSAQCEIFNNFVKGNSSIVSHLLLDLAALP